MRKKVVLGALAVLLAGGIFCGLSIARAVRSQAVREIAPEEALFAAFQAAAEAYDLPPADDLSDASAGYCWGDAHAGDPRHLLGAPGGDRGGAAADLPLR